MIIITGASTGLGRALAELYVSKGKRVIGLSRGDCSEGVKHIKTDLQDESSISAAVKVILSDSDSLEALVNCAGVFSFEEVNNISSKEIDRVFATNTRAPMLLVSMLMDRIKKDSGDIMNVASTVGTKGYPGQAAYGSSKWALRGFSKNLQVELKDSPIRVISFCPGGFVSDLIKKVTGEGVKNENEWMKAEDVALFIKQILDLPKNVEVSEVVVNRKKG